ncbi:MAG TPA: hypothetical protein VMY37_15115 [Thermoguttaceae bacterium]|nr:hypothetical protein [Thermoguttaceae bacterium]
MFGVHVISVYLLAVGLLTLLLLVLVWQRQRSGKTIVVWLTSAVTGILLGCVGSLAIVCLAGYHVEVVHGTPEIFPSAPVPGTDEVAMEDMSAMGMPAMGGPGMGGPGGGGGRPPRPKRDLTTLVRKIDLLTGDVGLIVSDEQVGSLLGCLADVETAETMSDDDAQAKHDEILAVLDEDQKSRLDAIDLPRRRPGGGGPGGPGGPGGGGSGGPGGGGPGGPGGGEQAEDANPFQEESNAEALTHLRERFGATDEPAEVKPPEVKPADVKPAEVKPAEVKPAEAKPAEAKPAE